MVANQVMNQEAIETLLNTAVKAALDKQAATHAQQMSALQENFEQKLEMVKNVKGFVKNENSDNESDSLATLQFLKWSSSNNTSILNSQRMIKLLSISMINLSKFKTSWKPPFLNSPTTRLTAKKKDRLHTTT